MIGYASLLLDGSLDGKPECQQAAAERIARNGHDLSTLFDALMVTLAGGEEAQPIDLREVVRQAVARVEDHAALQAASVVVDATGTEARPILVRANRVQLLCILTCLLGNAIVYSPSPARITVGLRDRDPVEVSVEDCGEGIPESRRDRIFKPDGCMRDGVDGFGLGLALSRDLAESNGGRLYLEWTEVGEGSTFVLALPRVRAIPTAPSEAHQRWTT